MLKPFRSFGRNRALDLRTVGKAESEKLPFLRSCHRALGLIRLEFELAQWTLERGRFSMFNGGFTAGREKAL
jgi:hypothetical protein